MFTVDQLAEERPVQSGVGVWVAARRGLGALGALKATVEAAPSAIPPGWLLLHRPVGVSLEVQGKDLEVLTNAATVGQLLSAMGIEPDGDDRVAPSLQTPIPRAARVRFDRVDVRTLTATVAVPFDVHTTITQALAPGQVRVTTPGVIGWAERAYRVELVNGVEASRVLLSERTITEPVDEVREVGPAAAPPATPSPSPPPSPHVQVGEATWYETGHHGLTAAHPTLPFGTHVTVTNLANGRSVTVVINDRGPFGDRIIDLSRDAFALIAPLPSGVCPVRLTW
jgi:hypothetical protein